MRFSFRVRRITEERRREDTEIAVAALVPVKWKGPLAFGWRPCCFYLCFYYTGLTITKMPWFGIYFLVEEVWFVGVGDFGRRGGG
jgi:hypothetical protein